MKIRFWLPVLGIALTALASPAQAGVLFGGELKLSAAFLSPQPDISGVSLDNMTALSLDYTHMAGQHFAWTVNYMAGTLDASGRPSPWYPQGTRAHFDMQSFTFGLQFHFPIGKHFEPYIGAGLNTLYSRSSSSALVYGTNGGVVMLSPSGGWNGGNVGGAFQAGLDVKFAGAFLFSVEAKYIANSLKMDTYAAYGTPSGPVFLPSGTTKLSVNPFIVSAGFGFRW